MPVRKPGATRPVHVTLIEAMSRCPGRSASEIFRLFQLIKTTTITENHDAIIQALDTYFRIGTSASFEDLEEVKACVRAQKSHSLLTEGGGLRVYSDDLPQGTRAILQAISLQQTHGLVPERNVYAQILFLHQRQSMEQERK